MGVIGEGQSVMPDIVGGIDRPRHDAYRQLAEHVVLVAAFHLLEHLVHRTGKGFVTAGFQVVA